MAGEEEAKEERKEEARCEGMCEGRCGCGVWQAAFSGIAGNVAVAPMPVESLAVLPPLSATSCARIAGQRRPEGAEEAREEAYE